MNTLQRNRLIFVISLIGLTGRIFAQLSFETRQLDFHPKPEEAAVSGEFQFTNIGAVPITIADVKSSCGCTTAMLDKKTYAPGEKGKITATFTMGDRVGLQQKQIAVRTTYPQEIFVQLTVRCFIPDYLKMEPPAMVWQLNAPNKEKVLKIKTGTPQAIRVLGVQTSDERLFAKLKTIEAGRSYEIAVTTTGTNEPMRAVLRVATDYPAARPKTYFIQVGISAPVPASGAIQYSPRQPVSPVTPPATK